MSTSRDLLIRNLGASLLDNGHCCFSSDAGHDQLPENFIAPLSHQGLLLTAGPDSSKFLQGQTTCNFNEITDHQARLGAFCNPKGRMISSFLAARRDDEHYLLRMRSDLLAQTQATFGKYIVFSKAEQTDLSEHTIAFGLHGEKAAQVIAQTFGNAPKGINQVVHKEEQLAIQLDAEGLSFECWIDTDKGADYWSTLSKGLIPVGSEIWQRLTIQRGIGEVSAATSEEFIPQLLNFPAIGAVSFDKGCYTGQEVVARMHYRGKSKRALYRISLDCIDIAEGQELYSDGEQSIGSIVNVASTGTNSSQALAVLTHSEIEKAIHRKDSKDIIRILDLPYAITSESE